MASHLSIERGPVRDIILKVGLTKSMVVRRRSMLSMTLCPDPGASGHKSLIMGVTESDGPGRSHLRQLKDLASSHRMVSHRGMGPRDMIHNVGHTKFLVHHGGGGPGEKRM